MINQKFPFVRQHDTMDCGPSCLSMIIEFYGKKIKIQKVRTACHLAKDGVSLLAISDAAAQFHISSKAIKADLNLITTKQPLPCILHWNDSHYVILYKIRPKKKTKDSKFYIMDPAIGKIILNQQEFVRGWTRDTGEGFALLLQPNEDFKNIINDEVKDNFFPFLIKSYSVYKREILIIFTSILIGSGLNLVFPFLTQALIDDGVEVGSLNNVMIIMLAQIFLFLGAMTIDIIKNWVLLFISSIVNINIISAYLYKLIKLPFIFFDSKQLSDFSTRIADHSRIEQFLTSEAFVVVFSTINFVVFFFVLLYYDIKIVSIYIVLTAISIFWSNYYIKKLKFVDYKRFAIQTESQQKMYDIINGIVDVKLNNLQDYKLENWIDKHHKLFKAQLQALSIQQYQINGYNFINRLKDIFVTFIAAQLVINNEITLGALLSIAYIIGQMNGPINQFISFVRSLQYAKLSLNRLQEVNEIPDEDFTSSIDIEDIDQNTQNTIELKNVFFQYAGPRSPMVLKDISLSIPKGKITALVGESGSGKTTLMKLLLKFYLPIEGNIFYYDTNIQEISSDSIRNKSGVVMQDGYIFSDTIMRNIITDPEMDIEKFNRAIRIANIETYINSLPKKEESKLFSGGGQLSGGQKQRILISRAVYKNPDIIFFDEATSSLDAENEKIIYDRLSTFFKGKTVIKIAHRLSTVKNADQIIVLKDGEIKEVGKHQDLIKLKGIYFNLVKNQLELGE